MTAASKANADPRQNQLLCALLDTDWAYWLPQLEQVELRAGQVLHDTGSTRSHLYFLLCGRRLDALPDAGGPIRRDRGGRP